jgi:UDP-N-acetylglucosamine transferase subunit ALG13
VIFVTVGTQLPFERLVSAMDRWSGGRTPRPDVLAQVGGGRLDYPNLRCVRSLDAAAYAEAIAGARLLVAHAGTGSILTALDCGVSVIIMPRDDRLNEHRDDHQMQTARQLERMGLVRVAWNEARLLALVEEVLSEDPGLRPRRERSTELVDYLRGYLRGVLGR